MSIFKYTVKDRESNTLTGLIEAKDRSQAIENLRSKDYIIINLQETEAKVSKRKKIKSDDLVIFSRQLATMLDAGIPLVQALEILSQQIEKKAFKDIIVNLRDEIETGRSLSQALGKYPKVFPLVFVNMVKAGESSGLLNEILERLAGFLEKALSLKRKIRSALVYPCVVFSMAIIITLVLILKVVPSFKGIFALLGGELPLPTRMLIGFSDFCLRYFFYFLLVFIIFGFLFVRFIHNERGRYLFDKFILKMFIFGPLFLKVAVSKFSRTLSTLIRSGVPILEALDIVAKVSGNKIVEEAVLNAKSKVQVGESIAEPLMNSGIFPPMVTRMISVGERTGELEKMLSKISDFYDDQVDAAVSGLTSMIEPVVIAFLGIVIGGIVISMFLPIFKLTQLVAR